MYPFSRWIAKTLASLFPSYALYFIMVLSKLRDAGDYTWMNLIEQSLPKNVTKLDKANHEV